MSFLFKKRVVACAAIFIFFIGYIADKKSGALAGAIFPLLELRAVELLACEEELADLIDNVSSRHESEERKGKERDSDNGDRGGYHANGPEGP